MKTFGPAIFKYAFSLILLFSLSAHAGGTPKLNYRWLTVAHMSSLWLDLFDTQNYDQDQVILEGEFSIDVSLDPSHFSQSYFTDLKNLEGLSGAIYTPGEKPDLYRTRFAPNGFKRVAATSSLSFIDNRELLRQFLYSKISDSDLVAFQDSWNFSDFFDRSGLITVISAGPAGSSHISVAYVAILRKELTHSKILGIIKAAVLGQLEIQQRRSSAYFTSGRGPTEN